MIKRKDKNGVRTKVKAIGRIPWGYDRVVEKQGDSWYVPDTDAFKCLDRAIMQIREGGHSVRKVATWLEMKLVENCLLLGYTSWHGLKRSWRLGEKHADVLYLPNNERSKTSKTRKSKLGLKQTKQRDD